MAQAPLQEPTFLVLASLADGSKHGYALIEEASGISGGRVRLKVGTLYAALERLERQGLVVASGARMVAGRRRQYYTLTEEGNAVLTIEIARMSALAERALAKRSPRPSIS